MDRNHVRLSLDVSAELNSTLDEMAEDMHSSKSEVLRKSIALMEVAVQEKRRGNHLGVFNAKQQLIKEFVGL
ncbi:MAG: ribbon-helix-helix protein, CopG family [Gammaproteobacteria bacterium]|nr:ribbon-helix-helix protein, CopG family [Gammaproteobacteria bacterium]